MQMEPQSYSRRMSSILSQCIPGTAKTQARTHRHGPFLKCLARYQFDNYTYKRINGIKFPTREKSEECERRKEIGIRRQEGAASAGTSKQDARSQQSGSPSHQVAGVSENEASQKHPQHVNTLEESMKI